MLGGTIARTLLLVPRPWRQRKCIVCCDFLLENFYCLIENRALSRGPIGIEGDEKYNPSAINTILHSIYLKKSTEVWLLSIYVATLYCIRRIRIPVRA